MAKKVTDCMDWVSELHSCNPFAKLGLNETQFCSVAACSFAFGLRYSPVFGAISMLTTRPQEGWNGLLA
jgi:hypothetical protein